MIFMNRLCQRKGNSNMGSRRRISTHRCVFFCSFFMFSTYFIPGWPPHYHPTTTMFTITSNHDDHYKELETRRYFHTLTLIPTTTSTCQHTTAIFGDDVWQMGARDTSTSQAQVSITHITMIQDEMAAGSGRGQRKESTNAPHTDTRSPVAATPPPPYKRPRRPFTLSFGPGIYFWLLSSSTS